MGSGIKGLKTAGIWDHRPGIWNHKSVGSRSAVFFVRSANFLRVQGSKFSSVLGSGIKSLGKNMGSVTKKNIPRYEPDGQSSRSGQTGASASNCHRVVGKR